jgi:hypothetical protein
LTNRLRELVARTPEDQQENTSENMIDTLELDTILRELGDAGIITKQQEIQ